MGMSGLWHSMVCWRKLRLKTMAPWSVSWRSTIKSCAITRQTSWALFHLTWFWKQRQLLTRHVWTRSPSRSAASLCYGHSGELRTLWRTLMPTSTFPLQIRRHGQSLPTSILVRGCTRRPYFPWKRCLCLPQIRGMCVCTTIHIHTIRQV